MKGVASIFYDTASFTFASTKPYVYLLLPYICFRKAFRVPITVLYLCSQSVTHVHCLLFRTVHYALKMPMLRKCLRYTLDSNF
jgi:hypothetical protein